MYSYIIKCVVVLCVFVTVSSQDCADWDHLVFTRQWPEAACLKNARDHQVPCCYIPKNIDSWTIHGVWPSKGTSHKPSNCPDCAGAFDPNKIKSLEAALDNTWPSLFPKPQGKYAFWEHEWNKHGRCGVVIDQLKDELHYFSAGIDLNKRYSLDEVLRSANIVPDDTKTYPIDEYTNALKNGFGADVAIQCFHDTQHDKQYVVQVEMCLDKSFKAIACPLHGNKSITQGCKMDMPLSYPPNESDTQFPPGCKDKVRKNKTLYFHRRST